jgi:tungstate transport system ATP-binding protein
MSPAMDSSVKLHITALRHSFGARELLNINDVSFSSHHIHLINGDNGAGKSTLLRILAGLLQAQLLESALHVDGMPTAARQQAITYVHQQPYLLSQSVYANLAYGPKRRGLSTASVSAAVERVVKQFALGGILHRATAALSGGERMKVALARGVATGARVILIDEPTANLDAQARRSVFESIELIATNQSLPALILIATHDRELLELQQLALWQLENTALRSVRN